MTTSNIAEQLRGIPVTSDLTDQHLEALANCASVRQLAPGEYLWRQGEKTACLYLVESGQLALEISVPRQGPLLVDVLSAGEIQGCSNWNSSNRCPFDARALTAVSCFKIDGERLQKMMEDDKSFGYAFLKHIAPMLAHKLDSVRLRLLDAHGLNHLRA